jgi:quercetin dioxygenase-like cupin family protein
MPDRLNRKRIVKVLTVAMLVGLSGPYVTDEAGATDDQYRHVLQEKILQKNGDVQVLVREHVYPPGWEAPTHYHDGDLFIYVVEGAFEVTTEEDGERNYGPGEAMQMAAQTVMDARNASDSESLKLVVFQIGEPGGPFLVPTEWH